MVLDISSGVIVRILDEAAASPDREVCGLLFGSPTAVTAAKSCANVAADPARFFELDPAALLSAHRAARAGGPVIVGHYHSHPTGEPIPSSHDADAARPDGAIWVIVARREVQAWRAVDRGAIAGRFDPVAFRIVG